MRTGYQFSSQGAGNVQKCRNEAAGSCFLVPGLIVCSYRPRGHSIQDSPDAYQLDPNIANGPRFGARTPTILPLIRVQVELGSYPCNT